MLEQAEYYDHIRAVHVVRIALPVPDWFTTFLVGHPEPT
jgi:hypothetical protein